VETRIDAPAAESESPRVQSVRPRDLSPIEVALALALAVVIAILMFWPQVKQLHTHIPYLNHLDPMQQTWQVAWGGHALVNQPTRLFEANVHWPHPHSLAFSDSVLGYAPIAVAVESPPEGLASYNLAFLLSYVLAFIGAYLLARQLGAGWSAALIAGAAFAYAPWKLSHNGHLNVISSGAIAIALFLLIRGYLRRDELLVVGGWLVATWQLSVGLTNGVPFAYLLAGLGLIGVVIAVRRRWRPGRSVMITTAIGVAIFLGWAAYQTSPYRELVERYPEATSYRTERWVRYFSPPPRAFLIAPEQSILWGEVTREPREDLRWPIEQTIFPGALVTVLAIAGLLISSFPRRTRWIVGLFAALSALLSLGMEAGWASRPFEFLRSYAPGWEAFRTSGRLSTFTSLGLGLLAAGAVEGIARVFRRNGRPMVRRLAIPLGVLVFLIALAEGAGRISFGEVPVPPEASGIPMPEPQVHLPTNYVVDATHMYWSIGEFPRIVNGSLGLMPQQLSELRDTLRGFPDNASVSQLRRLGVRSVVVHHDLLEREGWPTPPEAPPPHLNLQTFYQDPMTVYLLDE
jgi:hypothetical protein